MRTSGYILLCVLLASLSCQPYLYVGDTFVPESIATSAVTQTKYISHTSTELIYEVNVVLLDDYGDSYDNTIYDEDQFAFISSSGTTEVLKFDWGVSTSTPGTSSTIILIDESGSYEETDPANARSQVINKFLNDHQSPSNYMLASFSKEGNLTKEPLEYFNENFSTAWREPLNYIFDLVKRTGGKSSLFDAMDQALNKFTGNTNNKKELVVLVNSRDDNSSATVSSVLQKAKANNVRLHFIELAKEPNASLIELAQQTGGIYIACPSSKEMIAAFNHLQRLLDERSFQHRFRIRYRPTGSTIQSGFELRQTIKATDPYDGFKYNPAYVFVKVP